jgi:hypothetical protein
MKKFFLFFLLGLLAFVLPGCSVVSGIFKAGMWWAFFLVFLVVALVLWLVLKGRK